MAFISLYFHSMDSKNRLFIPARFRDQLGERFYVMPGAESNLFIYPQETFEEIAEQNRKRECNKLRDILLQSYRYYTNKEQNPSQSWTKMESEAFWDLFRDYEDLGGNGYMHTVVQPEMERLCIVNVSEQEFK